MIFPNHSMARGFSRLPVETIEQVRISYSSTCARLTGLCSKIVGYATLNSLIQLQTTCKLLYMMTRSDSLWVNARRALACPVPDPPTMTASGIWTEPAYAKFIFGGGPCDVSIQIEHPY